MMDIKTLEMLVTVIALVTCGLVALIHHFRKETRIDASGFLFIRSFSKPLYLRWDEIEKLE